MISENLSSSNSATSWHAIAAFVSSIRRSLSIYFSVSLSNKKSCITNLWVTKGPVTREQTTPCPRRQVAPVRNNRYGDLGVESRTSFPPRRSETAAIHIGRRRLSQHKKSLNHAPPVSLPLITVYDVSKCRVTNKTCVVTPRATHVRGIAICTVDRTRTRSRLIYRIRRAIRVKWC